MSSIKEYGAFVEFPGGQQGLLHMSELSHEPVSKVSDVLDIGQCITTMCIETDVRGNIKLSRKALLPKPKRKPASDAGKDPVMKESSTVYIENSSVGEIVASMPSIVTPLQKSRLSVPAVVIRTAVECNEAEKSSPVNDNDKPRRAATSKPDRKPKSTASKLIATQKEEEALESIAPEETSAECGEILKQDGKLKSVSPKNNSTASNLVSFSKAKKSTMKENLSENKAEESASVSTRKLKIGTEMTATVDHVRALGLVLDLGGEIRGMYIFQGDKDKFKKGDTLRVKCTSFNTKGVPVMALVDEEGEE